MLCNVRPSENAEFLSEQRFMPSCWRWQVIKWERAFSFMEAHGKWVVFICHDLFAITLFHVFLFLFLFFPFLTSFNYVTESLARLRRVLENVTHLQFVYIHFKKNFKSNNLYLLFTQVWIINVRNLEKLGNKIRYD